MSEEGGKEMREESMEEVSTEGRGVSIWKGRR